MLGIANGSSIAYGCAKAFGDAGAQLAISYLNAKAEPTCDRWPSNGGAR